MDKEEYARQFGRWIEPDEIVFDCDNTSGFGEQAIAEIGIILQLEDYSFEIWKAEGQKSPHLHIKNIQNISSLTSEQNELYKKLFMEKFINKARKEFGNKNYYNDFDFKLCGKHRIAEENKSHYKYKTLKLLVMNWETGNPNPCDKEIYEQVIIESSKGNNKEKTLEGNIEGLGITAEIKKRISIIDIARQFGLEVSEKGFAVCPFHPDNNPSLKFYKNQGRFMCFGCQAKGNIIVFYAMLKKLRSGFVFRKEE